MWPINIWKDGKEYSTEKEYFLINGIGKTGQPQAEEIGPLSYATHKN